MIWGLRHSFVFERELKNENSFINMKMKQCFHYTNLQPLWASDNQSKGNTIPDNHQPQLPIAI